MQQMQFNEAVAQQQHRAALRPMELAQQQRAQREADLEDAYRTASAFYTLAGEDGDFDNQPDAYRQYTFDALNKGGFGGIIDNDGTGKSLSDVVPYPARDGKKYALMLNVPQPDGTSVTRPLSVNRGTDDDVRLVSTDDFRKGGDEALAHAAQLLGITFEEAQAHEKKRRGSIREALGARLGKTPTKKYGALTTEQGFVGQFDPVTNEFRKVGAETDADLANVLVQARIDLLRAQRGAAEARANASGSGGGGQKVGKLTGTGLRFLSTIVQEDDGFGGVRNVNRLDLAKVQRMSRWAEATYGVKPEALTDNQAQAWAAAGEPDAPQPGGGKKSRQPLSVATDYLKKQKLATVEQARKAVASLKAQGWTQAEIKQAMTNAGY